MAATNLKFPTADYSTLAKVFAPFPDLESFICWSPQWSAPKKKWLKRPVQMINNPLTHLSLLEAQTKSKSVGLVCNDLHQIIALDNDGVSPQTPSLARLISEHPTYGEQSPSGKANHLRYLYVLSSPKDELKAKGVHKPDDQPHDGANDIELYNKSSNFVTLTGQHLPDTPLSIATIAADDLISYFPSFAPKALPPVIDIQTKMPHQQSTAILTPYTTWLDEVPCDRHDSSLIAFLGKHSLIYYDYWLLGLMSIHAAFGEIQGFNIADAWSKQSGDDYELDEVLAKWESISVPDFVPDQQGLPQAAQSVTAGTYQWMFNEFSIQWPVLIGKSKVPKKDELENFQAFLAYKGLTPEIDELTNVPFLDGADYAVYPTYYISKEEAYSVDHGDLERLSAILVQEAQPYKFRPTSAQVYTWIKDIILTKTKKINRFEREISSRPPYNPDTEPDYLKLMGTEIIQRNVDEEPSQEFHELLVRKWLLSLGRGLWPSKISPLTATSEGVLILSSPKGGINKSSFGVRLFPPEWQHLHVETKPRLSGAFEDKDSVQKTVGKLIVDFDEAERIFSHNDTADLKAYLTKRDDLFRPPYGRDQIKYKRSFSCLASTNLTDLVFPREGARRYWWLNVSYVDTYAMDDMDMYDLWRQIKYELQKHNKKKAPYLLTPQEAKYLEGYLAEHTTTNSTEDRLIDLFDFSPKGFAKYLDQGRLTGISDMSMSISEICNFVAMGGGQTLGPKVMRHAVVSLLRRHCPDMVISSRVIKNGCHKTRGQYRYFMPDTRATTETKPLEEQE